MLQIPEFQTFLVEQILIPFFSPGQMTPDVSADDQFGLDDAVIMELVMMMMMMMREEW